MRVLAISSYAGLGGSELGLAAFARTRPQNVDLDVLLLSDGPLRGRLEEAGVSVWYAQGYDGRPRVDSLVRFSRSLRRLLGRLEPDVVWARGQKAALLAVPACRIARVPLVWNKVDFSWDSTLAIPLGAIVNGVVGVSDAVTEALGPLRSRKVVAAVGDPIMLSSSLAASPDASRPVIGTLGRLVPYKGHHHIIRAAHRLIREFPELRVVIAGGPVAEYPDYPAQLEFLAAELGISDHVELLGFVREIHPLLRRFTVYVSATFRDAQGFGLEGLGVSMLQASWAGVPVVATRGGGTDEAVKDGVTGTLVEPEDPLALAAAIRGYLVDPERARCAGEAGRAYAREGYAPAVTAERMFAALASVARRRHRSG